MAGISLQTYGDVARLGPEVRFKLNEQTGLQQDGRRNIGNLFTRAWDCITRSSSQIESNKAVARDFVRALKEQYGDEVANAMSRDLSAQLSKGRPLTGHRIQKVMDKAEHMSNAIQANNRELLDDCLSDLTDLAMRHLGGDTHSSVLTRDQAMQVLRQAIEGSPDFRQRSFLNVLHLLMNEFGDDGAGLARQEFFDEFKEFAQEALNHEVSARLLPGTTQVRDAHGQFAVENLCQGLPEEDSYRPREIEAYMNQIIKESLRAERDLTPGTVASYAGMHEYLQGSLEYLSQLDTSGMDDVGKAYLDAMLNDIAHLQSLLNDRLGIRGFSPDQMRALLDVNRDCGMLEQDICERDPKKISERCPGLERQLTGNLEILRGIEPQSEAGRTTLRTLVELGERTLPIVRDLPVATANGLRSGELLSSKGRPEAVLARLGEYGFDGPDLAWMRSQGLSVGDTVMRFSPEQIRLLKAHGLGIEVGLQFLDKGIPIHERTLSNLYHEDLIVGEPRLMGGGTVSRPYDITYGVDRMVYKEPQIDPETGLESGYGPTAKLLGIDPGQPQMTVRNIATKVVDERLGFGLVPQTNLGMRDGRLGVVMSYVEGITPRYTVDLDKTESQWPTLSLMLSTDTPDPLQAIKDGNQDVINTFKEYLSYQDSRYELGDFDVTDNDVGRRILQLSTGSPQEQDEARELLKTLPGRIDDQGRVIQELRIIATVQRGDREVDFDDPVVRRDLTKLQLLDALTAQGDRHQGNYVVTRDKDGRCTGVIAIDNDQCFGLNIDNPNDLLHRIMREVQGPDGITRTGKEGMNGVMLPGVVDRDMKDAFERLTPQALRESLTGLLAEREIEVAIQRLDVIQAHLNKLEREGMVISPDQWGSEKATQALQDSTNSYVARDRAYIDLLRREEDRERQDAPQ